jgi:YgiT-type zinc finger domain-containing protein
MIPALFQCQVEDQPTNPDRPTQEVLLIGRRIQPIPISAKNAHPRVLASFSPATKRACVLPAINDGVSRTKIQMTEPENTCPTCGSNAMKNEIRDQVMTHAGRSHSVPLAGLYCQECGEGIHGIIELCVAQAVLQERLAAETARP